MKYALEIIWGAKFQTGWFGHSKCDLGWEGLHRYIDSKMIA
jgi:hypothetical protein